MLVQLKVDLRRVMELTAEAHGKVGTSPEEERHTSTRGKVAVPPADIRNSLFTANVRQTALVSVVERLDVTNLLEAALVSLNLLGGLSGRGTAGA